jgi:hypothetical protein
MSGRAPQKVSQRVIRKGELGLNKPQSKTGASGAVDTPTHVYEHKLGGVEEATVRGWGVEAPHKGEGTTLRDKQSGAATDQPMGGSGGRKPAK